MVTRLALTVAVEPYSKESEVAVLLENSIGKPPVFSVDGDEYI